MVELNKLPTTDCDLACVLVCDSRSGLLNDDYEFEMIMRYLPLETQQKILCKRKGETQNVALCNQILQRLGASKITGMGWNELEFASGPHGKPGIKNHENCTFNLSNCDGRTAMYIKSTTEDLQQEVGIDLASIKDCENWGPNYLELFRDLFSSEEFHNLKNACEGLQRDRLFTHYWSLKEAYTKYSGTGLNCDLAAIQIGAIEPLEFGQSTTIVCNIGNKSVVFRSKWLDATTVMSICETESRTGHEESELTIFELSVEDLVSYLNSTK